MHPETRNVRITSARFSNYKAFAQFSVGLHEMNILVGPNNSGKSTVLGVFRCLDAALRVASRRKPEMTEGPHGRTLGWTVAPSAVPISLENVHTDLSDSPSAVDFRLSNGNTLTLYFPADGGCKLFCAVGSGPPVGTPARFKREFPIDIVHVPVLGPVEHQEELVSVETVRRNQGTHRASRNFRSSWFLFPENFEAFADAVRRTWPGMEVERPERTGFASKELAMFCKENRQARELYWSGFGFQVWCQLLSHLIRAREASLLVLDEPEIYLHPNLQHRLLELLREQRCDVILATHSTEILAASEASEVLSVDKQTQSAKRLKYPDDVQAAFAYLGSFQNITLTTLSRNRRVLFVENKDDMRMVRRFMQRLRRPADPIGEKITDVASEGFANWERIRATSWGLQRIVGVSFSIAVVLDRDFRCEEELDEVAQELGKHVEFVFIHPVKEIENYLLVVPALRRAVDRLRHESKARGGASRDGKPFEELLEEASQFVHDHARSQYLARALEYRKRTKASVDSSNVTMETLSWFEGRWNDIDSRMEIVPGKKFLAALRAAVQREYGVSLTAARIVSAMREAEVPVGISDLIERVIEYSTLQPPTSR